MEKERLLKIIRRESDGTVWSRVSVNPLIYELKRVEFDTLAERSLHVVFTPSYWNGRKERVYKDSWGCLWHDPGNWMVGQVIEYPLKDWNDFKKFSVPSFEEYEDLYRMFREAPELRKKKEPVSLYIEHGFFFLRLTYLRGFESLMIDIAEEQPELEKLCEMITEYWLNVLKLSLVAKPDIVYFGDDLGIQNSLPVSPSAWRKYIKPYYKRIFSFLRENNVEVYLHSDGWILDIIPDLIECGVTVINPQDAVNGIENLKRLCFNKIAIDLDIDRQHITFSKSPEEIDSYIRYCIEMLGSSKGGLFLTFDAYPGTPPENVIAVMKAMEKYHNLLVK